MTVKAKRLQHPSRRVGDRSVSLGCFLVRPAELLRLSLAHRSASCATSMAEAHSLVDRQLVIVPTIGQGGTGKGIESDRILPQLRDSSPLVERHDAVSGKATLACMHGWCALDLPFSASPSFFCSLVSFHSLLRLSIANFFLSFHLIASVLFARPGRRAALGCIGWPFGTRGSTNTSCRRTVFGMSIALVNSSVAGVGSLDGCAKAVVQRIYTFT